MAEPGVEIVWGSVNRAWRKAGYAELWLQFRPRGSKDVLDAVFDAVEVANQVVEEAGSIGSAAGCRISTDGSLPECTRT